MEGLNTLVVGLEMLNVEGFASYFWSIFLGEHRPNYLLGEVDCASRSQGARSLTSRHFGHVLAVIGKRRSGKRKMMFWASGRLSGSNWTRPRKLDWFSELPTSGRTI